MRPAIMIAAALAVRPALGEPPCQLMPITQGGKPAAIGTIPLPLEAVRHAARNAILASGAEIQIDQETRIQAIREPSRVGALQLQKGSEELLVTFDPRGVGEGRTTGVTVETRRPSHPDRLPKFTWSDSLLAHTVCLSALLGPADPRPVPRGPQPMRSGPAHAGAIPLKVGTKVLLRVRNFVYSPDARPGKNAVLEVAEPVLIDGAVAIRRWALANARFTQVQDPGSFGRGARISMEADWVTAADGKRVALTAPPLTGAGRNGSVALPVAVRGLWGAIAASGFDAALLAGQILEAAVKADEAVSVQESLQ